MGWLRRAKNRSREGFGFAPPELGKVPGAGGRTRRGSPRTPLARHQHPHRVRCAVGHESTPRLAKVQQGGGICRTCAGKDPAAAWAAFQARVAELGAEVLETSWLGSTKRHQVRCARGHEVMPLASEVRDGGGIVNGLEVRLIQDFREAGHGALALVTVGARRLAATRSTRLRRRSKPARPAICLLIDLRSVTRPSTTPELKVLVSPWTTASRSLRRLRRSRSTRAVVGCRPAGP